MNNSSPFDLSELAISRIEDFPGRPWIIFLHDSLGCIALWRDFPERLGRLAECNVLVYDRQGYGKSCPFTYEERDNEYMEAEAGILNDLLNQQKIGRAFLFGHSDGGSIALIAASKYPDKIAGILTEGAHIFVEEITLSGIRDAVALYQTSDLKQKLEKYHGDKTDAMFWAWASTWTSEMFRNWNIEHFLPGVKCPSLIIQGKNDEYGTENQVDRIVAQVSGRAEKLMIPEAGHTPHKERPDEVLQKAAGFIRRLVSGGEK